MKGSVLSRWSRYARVLPPTALVLGALAVLPSCAGKAGQTASTPAPQDTPAPKQAKPAQPQPTQPAPSKPTETVASAPPAPAPPPPAPVAPAAPAPIDSAAVAAEFCKKITDGVQTAISKDSTLADPDDVVRKVAASVPDQTASVALAKNTTCR